LRLASNNANITHKLIQEAEDCNGEATVLRQGDQKLVSFLLNNGQCCWRTRGQQWLYKHGLFARAFQFLPLLVVLLLLGRSVEWRQQHHRRCHRLMLFNIGITFQENKDMLTKYRGWFLCIAFEIWFLYIAKSER
jgi:hypothetical protein